MSQNKLSITLPVEIDINLQNQNKIRIVKTKKESMFQSFSSPDSISNKIAIDVSEDPVLLKFLFLKSIINPSFYDPSGTTITFPFLLDPSYDFQKSVNERDDYKRRDEKLKNILQQNTKEVQEVWGNLTREFLEIMTNQPKIQQLLRSRSPKTVDDFTEEMSNVIKNNTEMKSHTEDSFKTFAKYAKEIQVLSKLKEFTEVTEDAQKNCSSINNPNFKLPDNKEQIGTALSTLAKHTDFTIRSTCLDCWYEKRQLPFTSEISRITTIVLSNQCPTCSGKGVIYKIEIGFPSDLNSLLLGETSWLYEVFIGHLVSNFDFIKKVYVHKKVQPYVNGQVKSGIEIDVIAITNDNKLIVIEVTKQHDESNIRENIETKIKNLEQFGIPYDKLVYLTASKAEQFYDINQKKTRIFGINHLAKIKEFIKEFVEQ